MEITWHDLVPGVTAALGALSGAVLGYIGTLFNEQAKYDAIQANLNGVILRQEELKKDLEGGFWAQQQQWSQKANVLMDVLKTISELDITLIYWDIDPMKMDLETLKVFVEKLRFAVARCDLFLDEPIEPIMYTFADKLVRRDNPNRSDDCTQFMAAVIQIGKRELEWKKKNDPR